MIEGSGTRAIEASGYNPLLDGLRGLAVVAVIGDHSGFPTHGFHGVTVFFVISGYLITTLLIRELDRSGSISLPRFYWRRLVRLGPSLVVVLIATVAYLLVVGRPISTFWIGLVGAMTYSMDLVQTVIGNGPVGIHFQWSWSLGVEEQFYLLWPLALVLLRRRRTVLIAVLVALVAVAWAGRATELALGATHDTVFFGPVTHDDALLLGVLVAMMRARWSPSAGWTRVIGAAAMIGGVGLILMELRVPTVFDAIDPHGFGQAAMCATAVVLWAASGVRGPVGRVLATPPIAYLGRLSYGLYLWNILTIVAFVGITGRHPAQMGSGVLWAGSLLVITAVNHRFLEQPLRRRWAAPAFLRRPSSSTRSPDATRPREDDVRSAGPEPVASGPDAARPGHPLTS